MNLFKKPETKKSILKSSAKLREIEIMRYQINIDNFRLAIQEIDENYKNGEMNDFRSQLESLLKSSLHEQKKEMIMLNVIKKQLEE